jgi:MoxR-like ATPase
MSDVAAIHNLVQKRNELKKESQKLLLDKTHVVDQILLVFFWWSCFVSWSSGLAKLYW